MLGNSGVLESSGDPPATGGSGDGGSNSGADEKDVRTEELEDRTGGAGGGNRWPRLETLALLKIRSEMDTAFRDSTLKAPLWEEVSRKMGELGHKRSAKKCKEKFENVYKYHKRTKDGRSGKSEGKSYRFFAQLEAFENLHSFQSQSKSHEPTKLLPLSSTSMIATTTTKAAVTPLLPWINSTNPSSIAADSSLLKHHISAAPTTTNPTLFPKQPFALPIVMNRNTFNMDDLKGNVSSLNLFSSSTSSSTASDEEHGGRRLKKKKKKKKRRRRYWKGLFKELTEELMEKQEEMQKRFLDALEKHESERIAKEEAWRVQETSRINREHEILVHERSMAATKDAAFISFLEKVSGQQLHKQQQRQQQPHKPSEQRQQQHWNGNAIFFQSDQKQERSIVETTTKASSNYLLAPSSSRWPKAEVEALIRIRTNLDSNYQENATKGPLWEEISAGMRRLGYNRSAKRCKEKWENINKYFKKVKESNKKRSEDSKTCPYFHQLDAIYKERSNLKIVTTLPLMVAPEQQLPLPQDTNQNRITESQKVENEGNPVPDDEVYSEEYQEDEEEGQEACKFEMVMNKTCSSSMDINNTVIAYK